MALLQMSCWSYAALEPDLLMLTVIERWTEPRRWLFFKHSVEREATKQYILRPSVRRWLDCETDSFLPVGDARSERLFQVLISKRIELGIDRIVLGDGFTLSDT